MALFQWAVYQQSRYPELNRLFHIPNGGKRTKAEAGRFRAEGVKPGVPDLFLPVPRGGWHGLFIELKRAKGGRTSDNQDDWLLFLTRQGYRAEVCHGYEEASTVILDYLQQ